MKKFFSRKNLVVVGITILAFTTISSIAIEQVNNLTSSKSGEISITGVKSDVSENYGIPYNIVDSTMSDDVEIVLEDSGEISITGAKSDVSEDEIQDAIKIELVSEISDDNNILVTGINYGFKDVYRKIDIPTLVLNSEQQESFTIEIIKEDEILLKESTSGREVHIKIHEIEGMDTITSNFIENI